MGGNKVIAVVVLIIVILGAIIVIVKQQASSDDVPQWVKDQPVKLISSEQPYTVKEFRQGDIMDVPVDKATGYRMIDGKLWAGVMTCTSCQKQIPVKAHKVEEPPAEGADMAPPPEPPEFESYTCPLCSKEANPKPEDMGAGAPAAPAE